MGKKGTEKTYNITNILLILFIFTALGLFIVFKTTAFAQTKYVSNASTKQENSRMPAEALNSGSSKKIEAEESPSAKPQKYEKKYILKIENINDIEINCVNVNIEVLPSKDREKISFDINGVGVNHPTIQIANGTLKILQKDNNNYEFKSSDELIGSIKKAQKAFKDGGKYKITIHMPPEFNKNITINAFACTLKINNLDCENISVNSLNMKVECDKLKTKSAKFLSLIGKISLKQFAGDFDFFSPFWGDININYNEFKNKVTIISMFGAKKLNFKKTKDFAIEHNVKFGKLKNDFVSAVSEDSKNKIAIHSVFGDTKIAKN